MNSSMNQTIKNTEVSASARLFSLDMLRGLDMLLLTVVGPLVHGLDKSWKLPPAVMGQFRHGWECFTFWDIIMPLFIFMCGAAIPLALPKRLVDGKAGWAYWRHVLGRVALLWFCGMLVQGNFCSLDPLKINIFSNTLQSIAVGYLATAAVMLVPCRWTRISITASLAVVYGLLIHFCGDYTPQGNFTVGFDRVLFSWFLPANNQVFAYLSDPNATTIYTWVLPSMMFAFMTLCGFHATEILKSGLGEWQKAGALAVYGGAMEAAGWILSIWVPVIKPIYTVSFTLQAMGWCVLALAFLYAVTDIWRIRRGTWLVILFGQFALTAYLVTHQPFAPALQALAKTLAQGMPRLFGETAQPFVVQVVASVCLVFALVLRRALKARK